MDCVYRVKAEVWMANRELGYAKCYFMPLVPNSFIMF